MYRRLSAAGAAIALIVSPLYAGSAKPALVRASQSVTGESRLGNQNDLVFIVGIAVVAAAILLLSEDDDPVSA